MAQVINIGNKSKKRRGAGFIPLEDEAIARAWIAASEDPVVGTEQKSNDFFAKVHEIYEHKFKLARREFRSLESIKTRCKAIHKECMQFSACYARVVRSHPTGVSPNEILKMATALYNGVDMVSVDGDCGKPFKFELSWRVLKVCQKFLAGEVGVRATSSCGSEGQSRDCTDEVNNAAEPVSGSADESLKGREGQVERPIGRKRAKHLRQKEEESKKKLRLAAESVAAQRERNEALKRHYEIMLFTNAPASCDASEAVEYFNIMRARALAKLRQENKHSTKKDSVNDA